MARLRREGRRSHIPENSPNFRCIKTRATIPNIRKNVMLRPRAKPKLLPGGSVNINNYLRALQIYMKNLSNKTNKMFNLL